MKDSSLVIILILLFFVIFLGHDNIKRREATLTYENKFDSLKTSYIDLKNYTMDLEGICNTYKSSREKKEAYHRSMPNYANLFE
jgi:hypothetical protein